MAPRTLPPAGRPATPDEVVAGHRETIPPVVFDVVNSFLFERPGTVVIVQNELVKRLLSRMPEVKRHELFSKGWLDFEDAYKEAGWKVVYDKPAFNEEYEANWTFTPKAKRGKPSKNTEDDL